MRQLGSQMVGMPCAPAAAPIAPTKSKADADRSARSKRKTGVTDVTAKRRQAADVSLARPRSSRGAEHLSRPKERASAGTQTFFTVLADNGRRRELPAMAVAAGFLTWLREHGLSRREWTVDDVWYLAEEDFAPALGFALPPRRVFLGALQKCVGVAVQYDKRVHNRDGKYLRKTTFYRFAPVQHSAAPTRAAGDQRCDRARAGPPWRARTAGAAIS